MEDGRKEGKNKDRERRGEEWRKEGGRAGG